ncbi:hypothetical protein EPH_0047910 [Eimeria praecox]|uniref:Uncharacterized protein n=1 Tax=Eimeria praecox TaxID=51316 RepID=U6GYW7_9EIME|nr:hypothetical protein EPH_0047910 [Eimeria praecox]
MAEGSVSSGEDSLAWDNEGGDCGRVRFELTEAVRRTPREEAEIDEARGTIVKRDDKEDETTHRPSCYVHPVDR